LVDSGHDPMMFQFQALALALACLNSNVEKPEDVNAPNHFMRLDRALTFVIPTLLARLPPAPDVRLPLR